MDSIIIFITTIICLIGMAVFIWSIYTTRRDSIQDYHQNIRKKSNINTETEIQSIKSLEQKVKKLEQRIVILEKTKSK